MILEQNTKRSMGGTYVEACSKKSVRKSMISPEMQNS